MVCLVITQVQALEVIMELRNLKDLENLENLRGLENLNVLENLKNFPKWNATNTKSPGAFKGSEDQESFKDLLGSEDLSLEKPTGLVLLQVQLEPVDILAQTSRPVHINAAKSG